MKSFIIIVLSLLIFSASGNAQCSKKVIWTAAKAEFLDSTGNITKTMDEKIEITNSKTEIKLMHSDKEEDALSGTIKDFSCNWKDAFKNGKTIIKTDLTQNNGDTRTSVITIEAKNGKITIVVEMNSPDGPLKIRVPVDSYKEVD
jgi:hypothetical protein